MRIKQSILLLILFLSITWVVYPQSGTNTLFEKVSPKKSGIKFKNTLRETDSENMLSFINFYTGAGVGILDVNNDGLQDIFFAGNQVSSRLYLNKGGFKFEDITLKSGVKTDRWITGVSIVDINQDGYDDIYLSVSGPVESKNKGNLLFVNNGDNTFTEKAAEYNLNVKVQTTHTSFFDYDRDGDLDAFLITNPTDFKLNSTEALQKPKINGEAQSTDILLRNDGNGKFTDVSKESGILIEGYSLGVNTSDFNHDGWIDIYVSNDYIGNDILYINNGDGTFTNKLAEYFRYTSFASMGNDAGDINNDGLIDLITLDMLPESSYRQKVIAGARTYDSFMYACGLGYFPQYGRNMLQMNNGNNTFSEIGRLAGISKTDWSWAPLLIDLDNDGYKDLFVTTGFRRDMGNMDFIYKTMDSPFKRGGEVVPISDQLEAIKRVEGIPVMNYVFRNNKDLSFTKVSEKWGFDEKSYSSGFTVADLDNDGDYDIIINKVDDYAAIYENKANNLKNHYLKIRLQGSKNNRSGIGSKITIYYEGKLQYIDNNIYRGYMSSVEKNILFGTGESTMIDSLVVIWPDGLRSVRHNVKVDATIDIQYKLATPMNSVKTTNLNSSLKFKDITSKLGITYSHKENPYVDFYKQPLLPHQHSQLGPSIAVGDINNDGLEDFFIGGARGFPATLFFQTSKGTFRSEEFPFDREYEDMGALLFDFDGDNDLDLYVVSGGTFAGKNSGLYQDRLYLNTGNGKFKKTENVLPIINSSGGVVTAADFDRDGDLDLFIGGRISPLNYPFPPRSYLLENRDGRFIDITDEKAPGLSSIGMVTSALWSDINNDGFLDLILVGEWMPVTVFENTGGAFINRTKKYGLTNTTGWWNSISSGNFYNDGKIDYMLGNLGLNNPYNSSNNEPIKIISKDYNNDGITEPLMFMKYADGYYPVASRSQFLSVFPQKAKKYDTFESYAKTGAEALLKDLGTDDAITLKAELFANALMLHAGDSIMTIKPLPNKVQFSPVFGTLCSDFNGKRKTDILCVGNFYSVNVNDGPYNAFTGGLISLDSADNIRVSSGYENGFYVNSDARALASLVLGNQKRVFIVTSNNDSLKVFTSVIQKEKQIKLQPMDAYAIVEWDNGLKQKLEFYYGSGYLSQSSRYLSLITGWKKVKVFTYSGKERTITSVDIKNVK
jgi:enediyne biosynthesis protein E4